MTPKSINAVDDNELEGVIDKLAAADTKREHPQRAKEPKIQIECVNIIKAGQQQCRKSLMIEGKPPLDAKDKAVQIKKDPHEATDVILEKEIEISCSYGVGDKMGAIYNAEKVYVNGKACEGRTEVKHAAGQVLLLEFWATCCPLCQKPIAHNQEMLEKRGADWGDKVRLIGLSIDQDAAKLKLHVAKKKWTSVEHYHVRNQACTADNEYGVGCVPHALLVDPAGTIVFMGHPASRDIEKDIDDLLAGGKLTGEGTQAEAETKAKSYPQAKVNAFKRDRAAWVMDTKAKSTMEVRPQPARTLSHVDSVNKTYPDMTQVRFFRASRLG